jgi:hypothetical protein
MAPYFFHLEDGNALLRDDIREEFGTLEEAISYASRVGLDVIGRSASRQERRF